MRRDGRKARQGTAEALDDRYFVHFWTRPVHHWKRVLIKEVWRRSGREAPRHERVVLDVRKEERWFYGHAATPSRWAVVPHMGAHVDLKVAPGGKSLTAYRAFKRLVPSVGAGVDLQGAGG